MRTSFCQLASALIALTPATLLAQSSTSITPKETAARREAIAARIDSGVVIAFGGRALVHDFNP
jgi:Xaa-Pro aminopeptidase